MNLTKIFKDELYFGIFSLIIFTMVIVFDEPPLEKHWLGSLIYISTGWAVFYFVFLKSLKEYKLDERESMLFTKTGNLSAFTFITILTIIFYLQEIDIKILNLPIEDLWGRFLLPIFLIAHSITGFILIKLEE